MKVGVVGTGNVGWALVSLLAQSTHVSEVLVVSRSWERVTALIMDTCSAVPAAVFKIKPASPSQLIDADLVILTSGVQMRTGEAASDVRSANLEITREIVHSMRLKPSVILITLATPVDDITIYAQMIADIPKERVFGFGGDLDRNRLEYVLREKGIEAESIELVGEHGGNAIPVYTGEKDYPEVAEQVRRFLRKVTTLAGETRNLSTAVLLRSLVESIALDSGKVHYVCGFHPEYQVYLTWGFAVGRGGLQEPQVINVTAQASRDLTRLVQNRIETTRIFKSAL